MGQSRSMPHADSANVQKFECDDCGVSCTTKAELLEHRKQSCVILRAVTATVHTSVGRDEERAVQRQATGRIKSKTNTDKLPVFDAEHIDTGESERDSSAELALSDRSKKSTDPEKTSPDEKRYESLMLVWKQYENYKQEQRSILNGLQRMYPDLNFQRPLPGPGRYSYYYYQSRQPRFNADLIDFHNVFNENSDIDLDIAPLNSTAAVPSSYLPPVVMNNEQPRGYARQMYNRTTDLERERLDIERKLEALSNDPLSIYAHTKSAHIQNNLEEQKRINAAALQLFQQRLASGESNGVADPSGVHAQTGDSRLAQSDPNGAGITLPYLYNSDKFDITNLDTNMSAEQIRTMRNNYLAKGGHDQVILNRFIDMEYKSRFGQPLLAQYQQTITTSTNVPTLPPLQPANANANPPPVEEINEVKASIHKVDSNIKNLQGELNTLRDSYRTLDSTQKALQQTQQQQLQQAQNPSQVLLKHDDPIAVEINSKINNINTEHLRLKSELATMQTRYLTLNENDPVAVELRQKIQKLDYDNKHVQSELTSMKERVNTLNKDDPLIHELDNKIRKVESDNRGIHTELESMHTKFLTLKRESEAANTQRGIDTNDPIVVDLNQKVQKVDSENKRLQNELESINNKYQNHNKNDDQMIQEFGNKIRKVDSDNRRLQEELEALQAKYQVLNSNHAATTEMLNRLNQSTTFPPINQQRPRSSSASRIRLAQEALENKLVREQLENKLAQEKLASQLAQEQLANKLAQEQILKKQAEDMLRLQQQIAGVNSTGLASQHQPSPMIINKDQYYQYLTNQDPNLLSLDPRLPQNQSQPKLNQNQNQNKQPELAANKLANNSKSKIDPGKPKQLQQQQQTQQQPQQPQQQQQSQQKPQQQPDQAPKQQRRLSNNVAIDPSEFANSEIVKFIKLKDLPPSPYDPVGGFVIFIDFVTHIDPSFTSARCITCLHHPKSGLGEPSILPLATCEPYMDNGTMTSVALVSTKQPVPRCPPQQSLTILIELQMAQKQQGLKLKSCAWLKIPLFDSKNRLLSGRWRNRLKNLPIRSDSSLNALDLLPDFGNAELFYRLVNLRDSDEQTNAPISPAFADQYYQTSQSDYMDDYAQYPDLRKDYNQPINNTIKKPVDTKTKQTQNEPTKRLTDKKPTQTPPVPSRQQPPNNSNNKKVDPALLANSFTVNKQTQNKNVKTNETPRNGNTNLTNNGNNPKNAPNAKNPNSRSVDAKMVASHKNTIDSQGSITNSKIATNNKQVSRSVDDIKRELAAVKFQASNQINTGGKAAPAPKTRK